MLYVTKKKRKTNLLNNYSFFCFSSFQRSLYPQLTSIYECVNNDDHESIRNMLSTPTNGEQRIICTWNLPRGKRPSRTHTESKVLIKEKKKYIFMIYVFIYLF